VTRAESLSKACVELGLVCDLNHSVRLTDAQTVVATARIRELGAKQGMLVIGRYDEIEPFMQRIRELGYGFSVLAEPKSGAAFDIDSYKRMFRDWGWSGPLGAKPSWMR